MIKALADQVSKSLRSFHRLICLILFLQGRASSGWEQMSAPFTRQHRQMSTMNSAPALKDSPNSPRYFFDQVGLTVIHYSGSRLKHLTLVSVCSPLSGTKLKGRGASYISS